MYTPEALLDVHARAHRTLLKLLEHCAGLDQASLDREWPGFGYPTVRLQLHHVIGAEEYWVGVIRGNFRAEDDEHLYPTLASVAKYREEVAAVTRAWLGGASAVELNTARDMLTWTGAVKRLTPAHIVMRIVTHVYHHQGQVLAMCRLMELPAPPGLDFPLD